VAGLAVLLLSPLGLRREPARAAFVAGIVCAALGFGAFHPHAPWTLLHQAPLFSSQHVPSRFFYPAVLLLALAFAGGVSSVVEHLERWVPAASALLVGTVLLFGLHLAQVARIGTGAPFQLTPPPEVAESPTFHQVQEAQIAYNVPDVAEPRLRSRFGWPGVSSYLPMLANHGLVHCYGVPDGFEAAAVGQGSPRYRGEAFMADGTGHATITRWTPNGADIQVEGAAPGAVVVYDMNHDPSWMVDGAPAESFEGRVAGRVRGDGQTLRFRYRPRRFLVGLGLALATAALLLPFVRRRAPSLDSPV
jgi:hypothetical protein